jgi:hypothetical protein
MDNDNSITGRGTTRDRYILCNALAYAIITIERLPIEQREASDREDMILMLEHLSKGFLDSSFFMTGALAHLDGVDFTSVEEAFGGEPA